MKNVILIILCHLTGFFACGQSENWSLQKCIEVGMSNQFDIKLKELDVLKAQENYSPQIQNWLPTVNLFANHSYNFGSTIDPITNTRVSSNFQNDYLNLGGQINVLDIYSIKKTQKDKIDIAISQADQKIVEHNYLLKITEKYFDCFLSQEILKIQKEQLINSKLDVIRIEKEVANGIKPKSDLYDVQLSYSLEESRINETEQNLHTQKVILFQLLNQELIDANFVTLEPILIEKQSTNSTPINPQIEKLTLSLVSNEKYLEMQKSMKLPTLQAYYNVSSFYYQPINQPSNPVGNFNTQFNDNRNQVAGLQLNIPIFSGLKNDKNSAIVKVESEKLKMEIEQENIRFQNQIKLKQLKINQLETKSTFLENTLNFAKESHKTTQAKFSKGLIDTSIYSTSKNQLINSEFEVLKNSLMIQYEVYLMSNLLNN